MPRRITSRRMVPAAAVTAALALTALTGCAQHADPREDCVTPLGPGALSDGVEIGSDGGIRVTGSSDILNAQRTVLKSGDTNTLSVPGSVVTVDLRAYDAASGELLQELENSPYVALPADLLPDVEEMMSTSDISLQYLLATSLLCSAPGDTLVVAMTPQQSRASQIGANATIIVFDVLEVFSDRAEGASRGLPNGFPAIAINEAGRPGVVLPPRAAPDEVRVAPSIVGKGEDLTADQSAIGHVLTVSWDGTVRRNTWEKGMAVFGTEENPNEDFTFREYLTGYPVGSQVVILDPNDGDPLVYVVDVIAVV